MADRYFWESTPKLNSGYSGCKNADDAKKRQQISQGQDDYKTVTQGKGLASQCIGCGQCESACPQHIEIIEKLKDCAGVFE